MCDYNHIANNLDRLNIPDEPRTDIDFDFDIVADVVVVDSVDVGVLDKIAVDVIAVDVNALEIETNVGTLVYHFDDEVILHRLVNRWNAPILWSVLVRQMEN